jgi:hypothetical protein
MAFNKRKRKNEENEWNWEARKIEQVNELKVGKRAAKFAYKMDGREECRILTEC